MYKISYVLTVFSLLLSGCAQVDDYVLGKDNTPKPANLAPIKSKRLIDKRAVSISKPQKKKTASYLKLKPHVTGNMIYTAEADGTVQSLDKSSLKKRWGKKLGKKLISGPTVKEGFIALATDSSTVILLRQDNGEKIWEAKVASDALSSPVIAKDKVIVKTVDGHLYALKIQSGEKLWVVDHGAPSLILKASSAPVIMDNVVLVGFSDGKLDAVDIETGSLLWQRSIAYANGASDVERLVDIDADPIVRGNIAYLATYQGYIGALSLSDGQFIWRKPASTYKNIAIDNDTLYMADSDDVLWAFNRKDGHVKWKQPALKARGLTEPVVVGKHIIVGDKTGLLHMVSRQNGEFLSRTHLSAPIYSTPVVSGKYAYVMTGNGKLNELLVS